MTERESRLNGRSGVAITPMRKGGWRVECHRCGAWWDEQERHKAALVAEVHWKGGCR